jgi:hypothetical protein
MGRGRWTNPRRVSRRPVIAKTISTNRQLTSHPVHRAHDRTGEDLPIVIRNRLIALSLAVAVAVGGAGSVVATAASASRPVNVIIAPPKVKPGNNCAKGVSGCTHGKFTGNFFGD